MPISVVFLVIAVILFGIGAFSRWWIAQTVPYYHGFLFSGLFFFALSFLWPQLGK